MCVKAQFVGMFVYCVVTYFNVFGINSNTINVIIRKKTIIMIKSFFSFLYLLNVKSNGFIILTLSVLIFPYRRLNFVLKSIKRHYYG